MPEARSGKRIVVIGGGPAGVFAAIEGKRTDPAAHVVLLTDEACEPYEKPPLSKAVLTGKALPEHAPIAGPGGAAAHNVVLERTALATAIDGAAHEVATAGGRRYRYDAWCWPPGSWLVRELPQLPLGMARAHYLRTEADARALAAALRGCKHLVVVGGGLIGLEAAASAAELSVRTTVLEVAPRILARVCDEKTGAFIADEHGRHGIDLRTGAMIAARARATTASRSRPKRAKHSPPTSSWSAPASNRTTRSPPPRGLRPTTASSSTKTAAPQTPRSSRPATRCAFPLRTVWCGWKIGGTPRIRAPSPAAMPRAQTKRIVPCRHSGRSNTTFTSRAWAGRRRGRPSASAGRCRAGVCLTSRWRTASLPTPGHQRAARPRRRAPPHRAPHKGRRRRPRRSPSPAGVVAEGECVMGCWSGRPRGPPS